MKECWHTEENEKVLWENISRPISVIIILLWKEMRKLDNIFLKRLCDDLMKMKTLFEVHLHLSSIKLRS